MSTKAITYIENFKHEFYSPELSIKEIMNLNLQFDLTDVTHKNQDKKSDDSKMLDFLSHYYYVETIFKDGIIPNRKDVIMFGLFLGMAEKNINELLEISRYAPLDVRDIDEMVILFIVNKITQINPTILADYDHLPDQTMSMGELKIVIENSETLGDILVFYKDVLMQLHGIDRNGNFARFLGKVDDISQ